MMTGASKKKIIEGCTVKVKARTWPGINKPGGVARVTKCNKDGTFDVSFILGGRDKNIEPKFVKIHTTLTSANSLKRAAAPKPGEFAAPSSKRKKGNYNSDRSERSENGDSNGSQENKVYKMGDIVVVEPRMWSGSNKPGGVGRVVQYNAKDGTVNVRYILGGMDKDVKLKYVKPEEDDETGETRSSKKNREKKKKSYGSSRNVSGDDDADGSATKQLISPLSTAHSSSSPSSSPSSSSQTNISNSSPPSSPLPNMPSICFKSKELAAILLSTANSCPSEDTK